MGLRILPGLEQAGRVNARRRRRWLRCPHVAGLSWGVHRDMGINQEILANSIGYWL